jgi:tetratricopeptide (TPR) repeat protein
MAKRTPPRPQTPDRRRQRRDPAIPDAAAPLHAPLSSVPPVRPSADGVALFQTGMGALQRHDYAAALATFQAVLASFPKEAALCDRSAVYIALCERELARRPVEPGTVEERLTAATAALNNGDEGRAERLALEVLEVAPQHDLALYLLAAVAARRGAADEALGLLRRALSANPELRAQVRHDADFEDLRDLEMFHDLMGAPVPPSGDGRFRRRR